MTTPLKQRLKDAREARGLTQAQVAEKVGMSQPSYSDLERGDSNGSTLLPQIAFVLGVRPYWLATGAGPKDEQEMLETDERELVNLWRSLPEESKKVVITQFRALRPPKD